jgi:hypothetical protein
MIPKSCAHCCHSIGILLTFTFALNKTGRRWNRTFLLTADTRRTKSRVQLVAVGHEEAVDVRNEGDPGAVAGFVAFLQAAELVLGDGG